MHRLVSLAAIGLSLFAAGAVRAEDNVECFDGEDYFIAIRSNPDYAGNQFMVTPKTSPGQRLACTFKKRAGSYTIGTGEDPYWFEGVFGDRLVYTEQTGPYPYMYVYDLANRAVLFESSAEEMEVSKIGVLFWGDLAEGTPENCPQFEEFRQSGLGAKIVAETFYDFASGEARISTATKCMAVQ